MSGGGDFEKAGQVLTPGQGWGPEYFTAGQGSSILLIADSGGGGQDIIFFNSWSGRTDLWK